MPPLTGSQSIGPLAVGDFKTSYYGNLALDSQNACRKECRLGAMEDYSPSVLREQLLPWTDQLVANKLAGYNCTGPTDFKIPVRVRANIGTVSLGWAHETMVFIHRQRSCFN